MASIEEELLNDAQEDARAVEYIRQHLPQELQEKFTEDDLYYFLDVIVEYYAESGILDAEPDNEGFVDIDLEAMADYMAKKAKKEGIGTFSAEDLLFIAQAESEFEETLEED